MLPLFCFFFLYILFCFYAEAKIAPEIRELARAQAQKHLFATVNEAVGNMATRGDFRYENMVHTIRDAKGEVIYLEVDTAMLAGAKAKLVAAVEKSLEENDRIKLTVPLGSISGWNLFSGIGLPVRIRIHPIGMTEGEIFTELEDCGINQTRHLIRIQIKASLYIVIPGENTQVDTQVTLPLGERVLVGDVPEIYLDTLGVG
ncbi:MAG: sporulation protein YunB [Clostridia bacterium]|nr:sporulation protein YunB [Clostridia bacterium]